jgi:hypothetical protein
MVVEDAKGLSTAPPTSTVPRVGAPIDAAWLAHVKGSVRPRRDEQEGNRVELYSSFLKLAPLLLLKLLAKGGFGPSEQDRDRQGPVTYAGDVVLMVAVVGGGFIAVLVLGDVLPATATTRWALVVAGCLSLLVLAKYQLGQIASLYRVRPPARGRVGTSDGASASPGESA